MLNIRNGLDTQKYWIINLISGRIPYIWPKIWFIRISSLIVYIPVRPDIRLRPDTYRISNKAENLPEWNGKLLDIRKKAGYLPTVYSENIQELHLIYSRIPDFCQISEQVEYWIYFPADIIHDRYSIRSIPNVNYRWFALPGELQVEQSRRPCCRSPGCWSRSSSILLQ